MQQDDPHLTMNTTSTHQRLLCFSINELMTQYRDHHGFHGPVFRIDVWQVSDRPIHRNHSTNIVNRTRAGVSRNRLRGGSSSEHQVQTINNHFRLSNTDNALTGLAVVRGMDHAIHSGRSRFSTCEKTVWLATHIIQPIMPPHKHTLESHTIRVESLLPRAHPAASPASMPTS